MLLALGVADRVIAVGDYDEVPKEYGAKPRVGGLLNPNIEKIIEYKPDLVVTYGSQQVLEQRLADLGIRIHEYRHGNVDETLAYIENLGQVVGREDTAAEIVTRIRNAFQTVQSLKPSQSPKVLLVHNRTAGVLGAFYSVGARAFQHQLIAMAGGQNIFGEVDQEVVQPSLEQIIQRAPDIIIETLPSQTPETEVQQRISDWKKLSKIPAVKQNRIHIVREDYMLVPGPRLDRTAAAFAEIIQSDSQSE